MVENKEESNELPQQNATKACATPDCTQAATMQCPTCIKMDLEPTYFCGQDCFSKFWKFHKLCHTKQKSQASQDSGIYTGPMRPHPYSFKGMRQVPDHIKKPDYAKTGKPNQHFQQLADKNIPVNDAESIEGIRKACLIGRQALDLGHSMAKPGVTTEEIDKAVHDFIVSQDAYPSPLNYYNFPRSCCTSVNEIICHGIPDTRPLEEGDIVNIDISVFKDGFHGDLNETYYIGEVSKSSQLLVKTTYESLMKAIEYCKPNAMYREVGNIISNIVEP